MDMKPPTTNARTTKEDTMKINGKNVKDLTNAELEYHQRELAEVIAIQETFGPAGLRTPKLGQYRDEQSAVGSEVARREGRCEVRLTLTQAQLEIIHIALVREFARDAERSVDTTPITAAIEMVTAARRPSMKA